MLTVEQTKADEIGHSVRGLTSELASSAGSFPQELPNDGSMVYSIPIEVPTARGGKVTPKLTLTYNSRTRGGWLGTGWNLSMTYIEVDFMRRTPNRPDAMDQSERFRDTRYIFVDNQVRKALVATGPNQFRIEVEDRYLTFSFDGNTWTGVDGLGTTYRFQIRQVDSQGFPVRWYLSMIIDTNQNWTGYAYRDTSGRVVVTDTSDTLFLRAIVWNISRSPFFDPDEWVRPLSWFKNQVVFTFESRPDKVYVGEFGLLHTITERLKKIQIFSQDEGGSYELLRSYHLNYANDRPNQRSLLTSVQLTGFDCYEPVRCPRQAVLPQTAFTYSVGSRGFDATPTSISTSGGNLPDNMGIVGKPDQRDNYGLVDLDGDARADYVKSEYIEETGTVRWSYYRNRGGDPGRSPSQPFDDETRWQESGDVWTAYDESSPNWVYEKWMVRKTADLMDMNGDGLPDQVRVDPVNRDIWRIRKNEGGTFSSTDQTWYVGGVRRYLERVQGSLPEEEEAKGSRTIVGWIVRFWGLPLQLKIQRRVGDVVDEDGNLVEAGHVREETYVAMLRDLTGDGIPDYIFTMTDRAEWWVFPGYIRQTESGTEIGGFADTPIIWRGLPGETPVQKIVSWDELDPDFTLGLWPIQRKTLTDIMLVDLNGDGLLDLLHFDGIEQTRIYLNNGRGFTWVDWTLPQRALPARATTGNYLWNLVRPDIIRQTQDIVDINGDSFPDLVVTVKDDRGVRMVVFYGTGFGFTTQSHQWLSSESSQVQPYLAVWRRAGERYEQTQGFADLNGDGLPDYVNITQSGTWSTHLNPGDPDFPVRIPDQLTSVDNGVGGGLKVFYQPSTALENVTLPSLVYVVSSLQLLRGQSPDGLRDEGTPIQMDYEVGYLWQNSRTNLWEFRGFEEVRRSRLNGPSSLTLYQVDDADLFDRPFQIESRDANGCTYKRSYNQWRVNEAGLVRIPFLHWQREMWLSSSSGCNPSADKIREREILELDSFGNVLRQVDRGDLLVPDRELYRVASYAQSQAGTIVGLPSSVTLCATEDCARPLSVRTYRYDGDLSNANDALPEGSVERGNLKIITQYDYDLAPRDPSIIDVFDLQRYAYDDSGNLIATVEMQDARNGKRTSVQYDSRFNLFPVQITAGLNIISGSKPATPLVTRRTYDMALGFVIEEIDSNNQPTYFTPDRFGRVARIEVTRGGQRVVAQDDEHLYDSSGMERVTRQYHSANQVRETHERFDGLGRRTRSWSPLGPDVGNHLLISEEIIYDALGRPQIVFDPGQDISRNRMARHYFYDAQGRPETIVHAPYTGVADAGETTDVSRNTFVTRYRHTIIPADGGSPGGFARDAFDANHSDELNNPFIERPRFARVVRNIRGQIVQTVDPAGNQTAYSYDSLGNLIRVSRNLVLSPEMGCREPRCGGSVQLVTEMSYDSLGRKLAMNDPDRGQIRYRYDFAGSPTRIEYSDITSNPADFNSAVTYDYDILGRVTVKSGERKGGDQQWIPDFSAIAIFSYDAGGGVFGPSPSPNVNGRLASVLDVTGATSFGYDEQGNVTHLVRNFDPFHVTNLPPGSRVFSILRTYSRLGRLESIDYNGLESVDYGYNSAGWLNFVGSGGPGSRGREYFSALNYSELGYPAVIERDAGISQGFFFNRVTHRLENLVATGARGPLLDVYYDSYDAVGNILSMREGVLEGSSQHWFYYDELYRLREARAFPQTGIGRSYDYAYTYDNLGNLRRQLDGLNDTDNKVFGYRDDGLQPHAVMAYARARDFSAGTKELSYRHGNLWRELDTASGQVDRELSYTVENKLEQMNDVQSGNRTTYGYDGLGNRAGQRFSMAGGRLKTIYYVGKWMDIVIDDDGIAAPRVEFKRHIYAGGVRWLTKIGDQANPHGAEIHYITDHQGSVRATLHENGDVIAHTDYLPFGKVDTRTSRGMSEFGFTGQELGLGDGLYFYTARYYDPELMRFITPDTIVPDTENNLAFNRYAYVYNNPINLIDPSGHQVVELILLGAFIGGVSGAIVAEQAGQPIWAGALIGAVLGIGSGGLGGVVGAAAGELIGSNIGGVIVEQVVAQSIMRAGIGLTTGLISGGDLLSSTLRGAALGAVSGFFTGLGNVLVDYVDPGLRGDIIFGDRLRVSGFSGINSPWNFAYVMGARVGTEAASGAVRSAMQGGDALKGALVGGIGGFVQAFWELHMATEVVRAEAAYAGSTPYDFSLKTFTRTDDGLAELLFRTKEFYKPAFIGIGQQVAVGALGLGYSIPIIAVYRERIFSP